MDVMELLEYLQEILETSSKMPITGKVLINKKEALDVVDKIINCLPEEFKKAQWVVKEKQRILSEATREAEEVKRKAMDMLKRQVENHDITAQAMERAEEIIASAQKDAKAMRLGARDYADEVLCQLQNEIETKGDEIVERVKNEVEKFVAGLDKELVKASETIRENVKELRSMK